MAEEIKELKVLYIVEEYNGDNYICSYETEYPKELKQVVKQSRFLDKKLGNNHEYKFFMKIFKNGVCDEWYRIKESQVV